MRLGASSNERRKNMRVMVLPLMVALCLGLQACAKAPRTLSEKDEQRAEIRAMANQTLDQVYQQHPGARAKVQSAAGYAVFTDTGLKAMFGGGAHGKGVAIDNATQQATYMKMLELQPGLGLGVEKFRVVFIFATPAAFNKFVTSGWEFGANAMAAAKTATKGAGARTGASLSPDVTMYQLTEKGLIVGISITGAKYTRDESLN
jgi:lipid-binding SYLF domain-containing protein